MGNYDVTTIGAMLEDAPSVAAPPRAIADTNTDSLSATKVAAVAVGGVLVIALGVWALRKWA